MSGHGPHWQTLSDELDRWQEAGLRARLWWRDDDAARVTPALDRLLDLSARTGVPVLLATIPAEAEPALADRLADTGPGIAVAQHGWAHANHAPASEKKQELGPHRPLSAIEDELARGRERLAALFGPLVLPVLVPPWNRMREDLAPRLPALGLTGVSTMGSPRFAALSDVLAERNVHLDPVDWRGGRGTRDGARVIDELAAILAQRRLGAGPEAAPIGLLTHHLVHDEAGWTLIGALLARTHDHPAVTWLTAKSLFKG
ncbi:polysaccharide deacetylase [Kaustia mangrovi]|uniref:Polysaccharide deacetylase n=1 Tax=Kaustia mangrovi TaxID=2593653 RepID=A0A7S8C558_9HYPH|nr:polysaccharide deacetylase family protein [Kaustia mangrovi]QPC43610.1 polysaccharide deacetylase [Kaustia mangrovi]